MLCEVVRRRRSSFCAALFGGLAAGCVAAVCGVLPSCSSEPDGDLCPAISGSPRGLQVEKCSRGTISLSAATYDATGLKTSYAFVVHCGDRSAYGIWSVANGLECVEGTSSCDGGVCTPGSNLDCAVSTNCASLGECGFSDGKCVLTDEGCSKSEIPCGLSGACHLVDGACAATSDTDCQHPFGACPDCDLDGPCKTTGACHSKAGACVANNDADCKSSQQCSFAGKCTLQGEACMAASDADCARAEVCRTAGQCSAVSGICGVQ
jgi:hypothetical protein